MRSDKIIQNHHWNWEPVGIRQNKKNTVPTTSKIHKKWRNSAFLNSFENMANESSNSKVRQAGFDSSIIRPYPSCWYQPVHSLRRHQEAHRFLQVSLDWFKGKSEPETYGFLPSNWLGFPVKIFPSSNSMNVSILCMSLRSLVLKAKVLNLLEPPNLESLPQVDGPVQGDCKKRGQPYRIELARCWWCWWCWQNGFDI